VVIILAMILSAAALTHVVPAGKFRHHDGQVTPGSFRVIPKINGLPALLSPTAPSASDSPARAAGVVAVFADVPTGMAKQASLVFMVMFIGGMFGVLRATGAIDAAIDRLLHLTSGNAYLLTVGLMLLLACGATFLGFISEYLAIVPVLMSIGERLRLPNLFAAAVVIVASMVGYAASVTNPIVLAVAQPLAGVPVFSGLVPRLLVFAVMFALGLAYVLLYLRRFPKIEHTPEVVRLTPRQVGVLVCVVLGGAALIAATGLWSWGSSQQSAAFIAFGIVLALVGGLRAGAAADAFLDGMRNLLLAGLMIGLAGAIEVILQSSQILDSIVQGFAMAIQHHSHAVVATDVMGAEMLLDVLIHSTSSKAAISLPILAPIAHLAGVSGQATVTALVMGGGLTNMVTPTNGLLLAFLAASRVSYLQWLRFIAPLFVVLSIVGVAALFLMST
jgi:uncharacterized ion transporter superfamily protein YfcC